MGLGKTIQALALILCNPSKEDPKTTLIVTPLSLIYQWEREIVEKIAPKTVRTCVHYGSDRLTSPNIMKKFDIVLTTYNTLSSEAKNGGTLLNVGWYRVILDEGHTIKNHKTATAKAVFELNAQNRWFLTGTPIQNGAEDLYSYFKFLNVSPFDNYSTFKFQILKYTKVGMQFQAAIKKMQVLLRALLLRRTKTTMINGNLIIQLPERIVDSYELEFSTLERTIYDQLSKKMQDRITKMVDSGEATKNMTGLLVMLMRLRQSIPKRLISSVFSPCSVKKHFGCHRNSRFCVKQG